MSRVGRAPIAVPGGVTVTLVPLGIEGSGKISQEKVHTVSLVFGQ